LKRWNSRRTKTNKWFAPARFCRRDFRRAIQKNFADSFGHAAGNNSAAWIWDKNGSSSHPGKANPVGNSSSWAGDARPAPRKNQTTQRNPRNPAFNVSTGRVRGPNKPCDWPIKPSGPSFVAAPVSASGALPAFLQKQGRGSEAEIGIPRHRCRPRNCKGDRCRLGTPPAAVRGTNSTPDGAFLANWVPPRPQAFRPFCAITRGGIIVTLAQSRTARAAHRGPRYPITFANKTGHLKAGPRFNFQKPNSQSAG